MTGRPPIDGRVVFDFCSGTGNPSHGFMERGWTVYRFDNNPVFAGVPDTTIADILRVDWSRYPKPKVVLFGPQCKRLGVPQISRNWHPDHTPKTPEAAEAWEFVKAGLRLIEDLNPDWWWMENPRAKLRKLMDIHYPVIPRVTVTYCSYGDTAQKPTDLWGRWPDEWRPRPKCGPGQRCHAPGPRGTAGPGSTQGKADSAERAAWPLALGRDIAEAVDMVYTQPLTTLGVYT